MGRPFISMHYLMASANSADHKVGQWGTLVQNVLDIFCGNTRNPLIAELRLIHMVETWGRGIVGVALLDYGPIVYETE